MKLNSLSFIIVLSLFAAIFSNSVTVNIDKLNDSNTSICLSTLDTLTFVITDSRAFPDDDSVYERKILKIREENLEKKIYDFNTTEPGQYKISFFHILSRSSSFGKHWPSNTVTVDVKEKC